MDEAFKTLPITDKLLDNPHMLANGRVVMDMHLVEVKTPAESKGPADLYKVLDTIPGDTLFTPAEKSSCPFTAG